VFQPEGRSNRLHRSRCFFGQSSFECLTNFIGRCAPGSLCRLIAGPLDRYALLRDQKGSKTRLKLPESMISPVTELRGNLTEGRRWVMIQRVKQCQSNILPIWARALDGRKLGTSSAD
jgi:hypothetical protein